MYKHQKSKWLQNELLETIELTVQNWFHNQQERRRVIRNKKKKKSVTAIDMTIVFVKGAFFKIHLW